MKALTIGSRNYFHEVKQKHQLHYTQIKYISQSMLEALLGLDSDWTIFYNGQWNWKADPDGLYLQKLYQTIKTYKFSFYCQAMEDLMVAQFEEQIAHSKRMDKIYARYDKIDFL